MTLKEAIKMVPAVKGTTTVLAAFMEGDFGPISDPEVKEQSLDHAESQLQLARKRQRNSKSDWSYWGYAGDVSYWRAVVSLMKASEITGEDNLPDVPFPDLTGAVVMDAQYYVTEWGDKVLAEAKKQSSVSDEVN